MIKKITSDVEWSIDIDEDIEEGTLIVDSSGRIVVDLFNMTKDHNKNKANAELIVRSVNCLNRLILSAETLLKYYEKNTEKHKELKALIKEARGKR